MWFAEYALVLLMLAAGGTGVAAAADDPGARRFDHLQTGFPLSGAHATAACDSCHVRGIFRGTPNQCVICHTAGSGRADTVMPPNHIRTVEPCNVCHVSTATFSGVRFQHTGVAPGTCTTCHNGTTAAGKPANHVPTIRPCDTCHTTTAWRPSTFSHDKVAPGGVVPGTCINCHNQTIATGKPASHIPTTVTP